MDLPQCPRCDSVDSLEVVKSAPLLNLRYCYCRTCSAVVLIDERGTVLHSSLG